MSTPHDSGPVDGVASSAPVLTFRAAGAEDAEAAEEGIRIAQRAVGALVEFAFSDGADEAGVLAAIDELSGSADGYAAATLVYTLRDALRPMVKADRTWFSKRLRVAVDGFKVVQVDETDGGAGR